VSFGTKNGIHTFYISSSEQSVLYEELAEEGEESKQRDFKITEDGKSSSGMIG
jgi:hypothetical protein